MQELDFPINGKTPLKNWIGLQTIPVVGAVLGCTCESKTSWPRLVPCDKTTATRFSPPCCVHTAECRIAGSTGKISLALVRELNLVWPRQDAVRLCANAYQETPFLMRQGWAESQPSPG